MNTHRRRLATSFGLTAVLIVIGTIITIDRVPVGGALHAQTSWRGLVVAPERRYTPYDADDYRYPQSVEDRIIGELGGVYGPYTGHWFASKTETDIEHMVARSEAHDSGLCAADSVTRRRFATDPSNVYGAATTRKERLGMAPRRDFRQTKIVCTLGPSSSTPEQVEQLAAAGMNIARLNMSHGNHASHLKVIQVVQKLNERLNHPIALLLDLQGPAIRTGDRLGQISLEVGQEFHVTVGPTENPEERTIHVDYLDMVHQLKVGDRITVDNGLINLEVLEVRERDLRCRVLDGGGLGIAQAHQSSRRADQPAVDHQTGRWRHPFRGGA